jgi:signal transduction histidine kinase
MPSDPCVNILLVDDRAENLMALEALLESSDRRFFTAQSGEEALKQLLKEDFALILLDVQMPGLNGFQTAELIKQREKTSHIPIIFLTAINKDEAHLFEGYSVGAVDYLFKPFNVRVLQSKVAVFCDLHAKNLALREQAGALRRANEQLQETDRYKDEFLSVISHELRTPLNFIMGFASILEDGVAGPLLEQQAEYLHKISQGAERMLLLVNDLLDFAKIQAGKFDFMPEVQAFTPVVEEVVASLKPLADNKKIVLRCDCQVPLVVPFDSRRLVQILTNLVGNAIKFTPSQGLISVRVGLVGQEAIVEVEDTGIGIAEDDFAKLFTRFRQLDMSTTRPAGGTGLGLSIAKALVEAHGGTISASSAGIDQGTTFRFTLPKAEEAHSLMRLPLPLLPEAPPL